VISTARQQTGFLDDTEIARDLNKNGVDFREAKKRPTTVYLILPAHELARHARWLRLIVTSALNAMMRPRRPDEPRVLFMMDEYPALGHMEIIETTWALVRGYGIQMMPVFQDMAQLRAIYKERADSFLGMAGAIVHLAPNDPTTIKWIMERAGEWHKIVHGGSSGQQQGREMSNSRGQSWHKERVPRWTAQDLYGMKRHYMLLALAGERDIWQVVAPHYYNVAAYDAVARKNPYIAGL
jgi:type IV secretion system protein VirD4